MSKHLITAPRTHAPCLCCVVRRKSCLWFSKRTFPYISIIVVFGLDRWDSRHKHASTSISGVGACKLSCLFCRSPAKVRLRRRAKSANPQQPYSQEHRTKFMTGGTAITLCATSKGTCNVLVFLTSFWRGLDLDISRVFQTGLECTLKL